jgi:hypothetical protein
MRIDVAHQRFEVAKPTDAEGRATMTQTARYSVCSYRYAQKEGLEATVPPLIYPPVFVLKAISTTEMVNLSHDFRASKTG